MSAVIIAAYGAVSGLGEQEAAIGAGPVGSRARSAIGRDAMLARIGLQRPYAARVTLPGHEARARLILKRAVDLCVADLDRAGYAWRARRVGLVLGTACGGMQEAESFFERLSEGHRETDGIEPTYWGPAAPIARWTGVVLEPALLVLGACASGSLAVGLGMRWLESDACDLVLAGGFDAVSALVASGFESLRAITARPPPRPFAADRDGMALGEGAAVLALMRHEGNLRTATTVLSGFGASSDAAHMTAPRPDGSGLAQAAAAALREASGPPVDLVSAHATATPLNDQAEFAAIEKALGKHTARTAVVHPFKAQIGHTMGAAGALELLAAHDSLVRGVLPSAVMSGAPDPATPVRLAPVTEAGNPRVALKLASAFGGANAALVLGSGVRGRPIQSRPVFLHAAVHVEREPALDALAKELESPVDRVARGDALVWFSLAAASRLRNACGSLAGAGVVVGSAFATIETNAGFAARLRGRGPANAEPRVFPYTSPNAAAGRCSMAFGLTGPSFAVGSGLHAGLEALAAGALLVASGDADRMVVIAADVTGPATEALSPPGSVSSGAVALLLSADRSAPNGCAARARVGEARLARGGWKADGPALPDAEGHRSLFALVGVQALSPTEIAVSAPPDALAIATFKAV